MDALGFPAGLSVAQFVSFLKAWERDRARGEKEWEAEQRELEVFLSAAN